MGGTISVGPAEPEGTHAAMSDVEVRWRLLVSAAEDYEPMFHALWEFGVPARPRPGAPSEDEIKAVLWSLIDEGLIELFCGLDVNADYIPLPPEDRRAVFTDPQSWRVREEPAEDVRYSTTALGDEAVAVTPDELADTSWWA